jgi:hypothetical protein
MQKETKPCGVYCFEQQLWWVQKITHKGLQRLTYGPFDLLLHGHLWKNARDDEILEKQKATFEAQ